VPGRYRIARIWTQAIAEQQFGASVRFYLLLKGARQHMESFDRGRDRIVGQMLVVLFGEASTMSEEPRQISQFEINTKERSTHRKLA
jgi:hypothetical protein